MNDWVITLRYTDDFMMENADKQCQWIDYDLNPQTYGRYDDILQTYKNYFEDLGLHPIAAYLDYYQHLRYISFSEFKDKLFESTTTLMNYIDNLREHMSVAVILRLAYPVDKSSLWVARLIYDRIRPVLTGVDGGRHCDPMQYRALLSQVDHVLIIYPDDCMYSGSQFTARLSDEDDSFKYFPKSIYQRIEYYSLCPFVSSLLLKDPRNTIPVTFGSYETLERIPYSIHEAILEGTNLQHIAQYATSQQFDKLQEELGGIPVDELTLEPNLDFQFYERTYNIRQSHQEIPRIIQALLDFIQFKDQTRNGLNIYFQHKLADKISIATALFVYGYVPGGAVGSLINNCEYDPNLDWLGGGDFYEESDRCPPSCYKRIQYTWRGRPIEPRAYLDTILYQR